MGVKNCRSALKRCIRWLYRKDADGKAKVSAKFPKEQRFRTALKQKERLCGYPA
jgi:hypothetical protein